MPYRRALGVGTAIALAGVLAQASAAADSRAPLVLEAEIPLADVAGRIDHLAIDLAHRRLFIAELGNNSLDVIDLADRRVVHRLTGMKEPQGILYQPESELLAVANADDGSLLFFHGKDFAPAGRIELGSDADNLRLDERSGHVVVGYGEGGLAVIDAKARSKLSDIRLAAHPEGFQLAPDGLSAYVNIPDARQIAVVDMRSGQTVATWPTGELRSNFPMAISADGKRLAVVFRAPPTLALLDARSGQILSRQQSCGDSDDVFFDERRKRLYLSCGEGAVEAFDWPNGELRRLGRIDAPSGARTSLFAPELDRLFVAARAGLLGGQARILVFRPAP
jgi:hypothetical protein